MERPGLWELKKELNQQILQSEGEDNIFRGKINELWAGVQLINCDLQYMTMQKKKKKSFSLPKK